MAFKLDKLRVYPFNILKFISQLLKASHKVFADIRTKLQIMKTKAHLTFMITICIDLYLKIIYI